MEIDITDVKLSQLFGRSGGWAQSMISRDLHQLQHDHVLHKGRPKLAESDVEARLMQFCLHLQAKQNAGTVEESIEFMGEQGVHVDRSWVR
jgi:hypothetical protein